MRLGIKLALFFWICATGISVISVGFFYREAVRAVHKEAGARLADAALNAAQQIDPALHSAIKSPRDESRSAYGEIAARLRRFREANPRIRHVYTLVPALKTDELSFVVDVGVDPPVVAHVGCTWKVPDDSHAISGFDCATFDPVVRTDKWGNWLSGYAPIKNSRGKAIAIVGLDMSVSQLMDAEGRIRESSLLALLTALALSTLLSAVLYAMVSRSIRPIANATQQIADGNLDCAISITSHDELGSLATSLNRMVVRLKENQSSLIKRANTDGLTGLYNHRYFHERLTQELKRAARYGRPLSLLIMDLDGFKGVNDTLGHQAGDQVLKTVAASLTEQIRDIDLLARYGGDEFAVILPETSLDEAMQMGNRIAQAIGDHPELSSRTATGFEKAKADWRVTVSVGAAECPTHARQKDALVSAADIAMYHAKHVSQESVSAYDEVPGAGGSMDPCRIYSFLQSASVGTITALAEAVDAKDHYTHGHSEAVARYTVGIATEMRLSEEDKFHLRVAAMLHDVGKIGMPDTILNNPGKLSIQEKEIVRGHPTVGERIVKQVPELNRILPGILYHHERYDGTGYPSGLVGDRIPIAARIICVADSFDAMTSTRPYRAALSLAQAIEELSANKRTQFDPDCVDALARWLDSEQLQAA